MKSSGKKLAVMIVSVVLVIALAGGGILFAVKKSGKPVKVAPVSAMNNGGYWNSSTDLAPYGNVTTNMNQEILYDESLVITEIFVSEGDTVRIGDPLIAYDTTLVSLELEMKQMEVEGIGLNIQNVTAELEQLRKTKPVASASPTGLAGMALATAADPPESSDPGEPSDPAGPSDPADSSDPALPAGTVYSEITADSVPYKGSGTTEDPFRYYVCPAKDKAAVTVRSDYLKKALAEKTTAVFDTVDQAEAPRRIVSSWEMNWNTVSELLKTMTGTELPEALRNQPVYREITADALPYNLPCEGGSAIPGIEAGDGSPENPFRILCIPGAHADAEFLSMVLDSQSTYVFEAVDDAENPSRILYSWTLNGKAPETPEDPGMDDPGIIDPGIDIPTGPTKEELAREIREKEELLKTLDLNKRTAELELRQLQKKMDDGVIESTLNGTVKSVIDEETAKLEGSPLIKVSGEEGFYVTGAVSETALGKVETGMTVTVTSWNMGMSYEATITSISSSPFSGNYYSSNPNMSYYPFTAVISGDADLSNGEGVDLSMDGFTSSYDPNAIFLSQAFVREEGTRYYVYKKGEDGRLTKQYVEAGKVMYGSIEIRSGLDMDDEIAFPYGRDVKEGARTEQADTLYDYGY